MYMHTATVYSIYMYSRRCTDHIKGEDRVWEVWIVLCVLDVLGLDGNSSTLKLNQWRGDLQQLEPPHVPHSPAQHLCVWGGGGGGGYIVGV